MIKAMDNEVVWKIIHRGMKVPNHYNQDAAAKASAIERIIQQYNMNLQIERVDSHRKITRIF